MSDNIKTLKEKGKWKRDFPFHRCSNKLSKIKCQGQKFNIDDIENLMSGYLYQKNYVR